jgi:hypothetical protein
LYPDVHASESHGAARRNLYCPRCFRDSSEIAHRCRTRRRRSGQDGTSTRLLPLSVDGLILATSLVLLHEAGNGLDAPRLARVKLGSRDRLDPDRHDSVLFRSRGASTEFELPVPSRGSVDEVPALRPVRVRSPSFPQRSGEIHGQRHRWGRWRFFEESQ